MKPEIFDSVEDLASAVADRFAERAREAERKAKIFSVALPGGSTPRFVFEELSSPSRRDRIPWGIVHLFWGDERCVPPDHRESNFRLAGETFIEKISIPEINVHRIRGEDEPQVEAERYSKEIVGTLKSDAGRLPRFDWILLGVGLDGHTASLFPGSPMLRNKDDICVVTEHPETGRKRITLTLPVLNNAARISFLVTGREKAEVVARILKMDVGSPSYPASLVRPKNGTLESFLDRQAASLLQDA